MKMNLKSPDVVWHPCMRNNVMKKYGALEIKSAESTYITLKNGQQLIDATSSWWCKLLGHAHPRLQSAIKNQMAQFEHVIFANTTYELIVELAEKLLSFTPHLQKVFFAGDGSSAIEIALKMSWHVRKAQNKPHKKLFVALENGYHGETLGALSVTSVDFFRLPYADILLNAHFISPPYVLHPHDPKWHECDAEWEKIKPQLDAIAEYVTAIIVEPLVQGSGGMRIYSPAFLKHLQSWAIQHDVHLIADEIMTGLGRTGKMFAYEYAAIEPDFICLGKGLTAGWLAFSAVLTRSSICDVLQVFPHSHTYSGNALGASVALEVLKIIEEEKICDKANEIGKIMYQYMQEIAMETGKLSQVRQLGAIVAANLLTNDPDLGLKICQRAIELGVLLRPLGNVLYWFPPLTINLSTLSNLKEKTARAIHEVCTSF